MNKKQNQKVGDNSTAIQVNGDLVLPNNIEVHLEKKEICDFVFTNTNDIIPTNYFMGRQDEVKKLENMVRNNERCINVSGMGGIGKTHICRYLFNRYINQNKGNKENLVDCVGYLRYKNSMDETLVEGLKFERTFYDVKQDTSRAWEKIKNISNNKKMVLFIDNVNKTFDEDESLRQLYNLTGSIIITSRYKELENFIDIEIDRLDLDLCRELFTSIYKSYIDDSDSLIYILEELVSRHTKTVELIAMIAKDRDLSICELKNLLLDKKFNISYLKGSEKITIYAEYEKLFSLSKLNPNTEINVLEGFAIFPYEFMDIQECNNWFNKDANISDEVLIFNRLYKKGWLEKHNRKYAMHPLISEMLRNRRVMTKNHKHLIKRCKEYIIVNQNDNDKNYNPSIQRSMKYLHTVEIIAQNIKGYDKDVECSHLFNEIGVAYGYSGEYKKALNWYQKALDIYKKVLGVEHPSTVTMYNNIGLTYSKNGENGKALEWYKKCLAIHENILDNDSTVIMYNNITLVYLNKGEYKKALEWSKKALDICEKGGGKENGSTAITYNNLAAVYLGKGKYNKALEWFQKALKISENVLGKDHPQTAVSYNNIARIYEEIGEFKTALEWYQKALHIREQVLGKEHLETGMTYNDMAGLYVVKGEFNKAFELYQKALAINEQVLGKEHPSTASTYNNIALIYYYEGKYEKSLKWYKKALNISEKVLGIEHPETAIIYDNIAGVYSEKGQYEKALEWCEKALNISEKVLGKEHLETATIYKNIGLIYFAKRKYKIALQWYHKNLEIIRKLFGKEHILIAEIYNNIALVFLKQGEYNKSLEYYKLAFFIINNNYGTNHTATKIVIDDMKKVYLLSGRNSSDFKDWLNREV
ncbi:tetratricopeptide repeat protein [Vallitalea guaymasensis]|uniref:tetratricopeptide repeat protein n=1 Tax=Vallitalea guaymasensis TaxID=1185412 RepID=UPI0023571EFE|nr:tetratricopeptide repeat protein [Vallitalea guaymasensis]